MKKNLLALFAIAAALAGCTKTEMVDRSGNTPIGFANAYIGHPVDSRAVSLIEKANISEFIVYGGYTDMTHVFNGVSVTGTPETDDWTYGTTRYWVAGQTYKFAAYAPAAAGSNGTVATDFANGALNFTGYTSDPTHQNDLIYATAGQTTDDPLTVAPDKIQFKFSHLLSMIKFTFNSGFGNDITVTVENLKVSGMVSQGDYTGSTAAWTPGAAVVEPSAPFSELASQQAVNTASRNTSAASVDFAVIPQTIVDASGMGTKVSISFDVKVQDSSDNYIVGSAEGGVNVTSTLPGYTWTAGNRYNYSVTIKGENVGLYPIEFGTPDVTPITDADFDGNDEVTLP